MPVSNLREILKYVPEFRDRLFVIAIDGEVLASPNFPNIILDLAVLRSLSIRIVLIHGAGHQIRELARHRGKHPTNTDGDGVTDRPTLTLSLDAASRLSHEIMRRLATMDLDAAYANVILARPVGIVGGTDYQHTGHVQEVDSTTLDFLLEQNIIPVIPPIGFDREGRTYRINSDAIALRVAEKLQATKIIYLTNSSGVALDGVLQRQLSAAQLPDLLRRRALTPPELRSKLERAAEACTAAGIPRVHLLNGLDNEALLGEIFHSQGVGTMIHSDEYTHIRRAAKKDLRSLLSILQHSAPDAAEWAMQRKSIERNPQDYWILELDRRQPVAFIGLQFHSNERKAELRSLHVIPEHQGKGHARRLLQHAEKLCRERDFPLLFVLSRRLFHYLRRHAGFTDGPPAALPRKALQEYHDTTAKPQILLRPIERAPV